MIKKHNSRKIISRADKNIKHKAFKSKNLKLHGYLSIIIFLLLILADRLTKTWAMNLSHNLDYGIIAFTYITNTGAGFSILQNTNTILLWLSIIVLGVLIYFKEQINRFSFLLIITGIIGNLIDRIFYGNVIDFINLKFWPVFNVADSLICIGVVWWAIFLLKDGKKDKKR